jgi:hypothetical protein
MITDRTEVDRQRWLHFKNKLDSYGWDAISPTEQLEWLAGLKGGYNHTDLNRVGLAVDYLSGRFTDLPSVLMEYRNIYGVASDLLFEVPYDSESVVVNPKTDWQMADTIRISQAAQLLSDLTVLRGVIILPAGTPSAPPDMDELTISEANDMERLLLIVEQEINALTEEMEKWIRDTAAAWLYSAEPFSGEV